MTWIFGGVGVLLGMMVPVGMKTGSARRWLMIALVAGVAGAAGYGYFMSLISNASGADKAVMLTMVISEGLNCGVFALLVAVVVWFARRVVYAFRKDDSAEP